MIFERKTETYETKKINSNCGLSYASWWLTTAINSVLDMFVIQFHSVNVTKYSDIEIRITNLKGLY